MCCDGGTDRGLGGPLLHTSRGSGVRLLSLVVKLRSNFDIEVFKAKNQRVSGLYNAFVKTRWHARVRGIWEGYLGDIWGIFGGYSWDIREIFGGHFGGYLEDIWRNLEGT